VKLVPVIGVIFGAVTAVLTALFRGPDEDVLVALLFLLVKQLEENVLVPRVMGNSVGVHSLWVLFAPLVAMALCGVVGAVFAVLIVATIVVLRYLKETPIFERWQKAFITEIAFEEHPQIAVIGGELAGIRGSVGGEG
jgi:predicted PurR-regulated permease PerM